MNLSEVYPSPADLVESEMSVLSYLKDHPYIKELQPNFALHAAQYLERNRLDKLRFEFFSYVDVSHASVRRSGAQAGSRASPNMRLIIATRIERLPKNEFGNVTYCFAICRARGGGRYTILRKFHFDVTCAGTRLQEQPRFHVQYCGEMIPQMTQMGCKADQLDQMHPWLSEPRIFIPPISLALLLDMAFHEFPDAQSAKFRQDPYWRSLIRKQENLILLPFHNKCSEIIKARGETLAEAFYVG
jgi:hypothetical protein